MTIDQVKQYLSGRMEKLDPSSEEYRIVGNRLAELEYHEGLTAGQVKVHEIIETVKSEIARQEQQEQKIAEVDEMELPFDFDVDFEADGLNDIIRDMIKNERKKNFADFDAEYERLITDYSDKLRGAEERELQLSRQNDELQRGYQELKDMYDSSASDYALYKENHEETVRRLNETNLRLAEVEQNRRNTADQLEEAQAEILRLEDQLDEMRRANVFGERKAQQIIDVTPTTNELYEQAKKATAAKRQVIITGQVGANFSTVQLPDGGTEVLHKDVIAQGYEVVDSFLEMFEAPAVHQHVTSGIYQGVSESDMGDRGREDQVESVSNAEESNPLPTNESTEAAQETQDSEEATEAIYAPIGMRLTETHEEWVTRTLNELQREVYGERVKVAA